MEVIELSIPKEFADLLGKSPKEVQQSVHELLVLSFYRDHKLSAGRAAKLLGMDRLSFIRWSGELGIPYIDMTPEELQQDLRTLEAMDRPDTRS